MFTTVKDFIICVAALNDMSEAWDIFEYECSEHVRNTIYKLADKDSSEPFRNAMDVLGFEV